MASYVTDTHPLIWHLTSDGQLGVNARQIFTEADQGRHVVIVPSIVLVETVFIGEKQKHGITLGQVAALLDKVAGSANYVVDPLDLGLIQEMQKIPRSKIREMPDRIIVATALRLGLPLITEDTAIVASQVIASVW
ncbi:MAG: twitching motility protein PilT [Nitrospira sp.]|nr:MAG: twitching motility protein PilT [Nitrospira sp.]